MLDEGWQIRELLKGGVSFHNLGASGVDVSSLSQGGVPAKVLVEELGFKLGSFLLPEGTMFSIPDYRPIFTGYGIFGEDRRKWVVEHASSSGYKIGSTTSTELTWMTMEELLEFGLELI